MEEFDESGDKVDGKKSLFNVDIRHDMTFCVPKVPLNPNQPTNVDIDIERF